MPLTDLLDGPFIRDDDEGLFSRDIGGQLVRLDAPTESDYEKQVTLQIDGKPITVPLAEPLKDANGNIIVDINGQTTPRYTTIYDAAVKLYAEQAGEKIPIPVLCHQPHMQPVAVCRLCVVQIYGMKRGRRAAERKLLPACQHQVKDGMEVFTMNAEGADGERVRGTVKVMTELLASEHLKEPHAESLGAELTPHNELGQMVELTKAQPARFSIPELKFERAKAPPRVGRRSFDASSPVFLVDHSACVLCDRCVRACDEVMENNVIGRTGKGATAGIGFDLNDPMGESSCVKCGECMVSCPTTAITFKPVARVQHDAIDRNSEILPATELVADPLFRGVPPKFLLWQQGLVVKRKVKRGQFLCRQGDPGNTAFIIKKGRLKVTVYPKADAKTGRVLGALTPLSRKKPLFERELTPEDVIAGEMSCLTGTPRSADVEVMEDGEVWQVRRNVLDRLMRLPAQKERFEREYRERSLELVLQSTDLFKGLEPEEYVKVVQFLRDRLSFVSAKPGQLVFQQGDRVSDLYLVRLGNVRIGVSKYGREARVLSVGPGAVIGEIGLLALSPAQVRKPLEQVDREVKEALDRSSDNIEAAFQAGKRNATCSALGYLELARLGRADFLQLLRMSDALRRRVVEQSLRRLEVDGIGDPFVEQYVEQGLFEGQSILALDMDLCTRCDECTKGCVEQHGSESHGRPITRLLRDGLRFDHFTIATSCRSCTEAHCMVGCPVDAIHRGRHLQIVIEDHCIGCGLCAANCPYGSIFMVPNEHRRIQVPDPSNPGDYLQIAQPKAAACDLCDSDGDRVSAKPRCVAACPHEAAGRYTGDELLAKVSAKAAKRG